MRQCSARLIDGEASTEKSTHTQPAHAVVPRICFNQFSVFSHIHICVCVCLNVERNIIIIHFVMRIIISIPPEIMISRYWNAKLLLYNVNVNTHYYLFILLCEVECAESIEAEIRCRLIYHSPIVHVHVDSIMNYIE